MTRIVDLKTFIPEKGVWVSTVAYDREIGLHRCAETMVFAGEEEEITDYGDLYMESHGWMLNEGMLQIEHNRIVEGIRSGLIEGDWGATH